MNRSFLMHKQAWRSLLIPSMLLLALPVLSLAPGGSAYAQFSSPVCRFLSSSMNFGTLNPNSVNDSVHDISFSCDVTFAYNASDSQATFKLCLYMGEDAGTKPGYNPWRYMTNNNVTGTGTAYLAYNLYADSGRTQILSPNGSGVALVQSFTLTRPSGGTYVTGSGTIRTYARVPSGQTSLPANSYYSYNPPFTLVYQAVAGSSAPSSCVGSGSVTTAGQIQMQAQITDSCSVDAASVDFGVITNVGTMPANRDALGSINVVCSNSKAYTIYLGDGNNRLGSGLRQMALGNDRLAYQLYLDSAHTTVWSSTAGISKTGTGNTQSTPVYARIPSGTAVSGAPGEYADTVIVTVSY